VVGNAKCRLSIQFRSLPGTGAGPRGDCKGQPGAVPPTSHHGRPTRGSCAYFPLFFPNEPYLSVCCALGLGKTDVSNVKLSFLSSLLHPFLLLCYNQVL
jgi:hypothetical protein